MGGADHYRTGIQSRSVSTAAVDQYAGDIVEQ